MRVVQKQFRIQVFLGKRLYHMYNRHIDLPVQQRTGCRCGIRGKNLEAEAGIPLAQATDYGRDKSGSNCNRSSNSQFPGGWIGNEPNILDALRQLVKTEMPRRRSARPYSVGSIPCEVRSRRRTPSALSSSAIDLEMAG